MHILLAVDGSTYTKRTMAYLATHSELFANSNTYTLLTVSSSRGRRPWRSMKSRIAAAA